MPAYESDGFDPPAPIARSTVVGPAGTCADVHFLIDSGADVSVIPQWAADEVGAEWLREGVALRLHDGSEATSAVAHLRLRLLRYGFDGTFVVTDSAYGILGRNILRHLVLTLDGPRQLWSA